MKNYFQILSNSKETKGFKYNAVEAHVYYQAKRKAYVLCLTPVIVKNEGNWISTQMELFGEYSGFTVIIKEVGRQSNKQLELAIDEVFECGLLNPLYKNMFRVRYSQLEVDFSKQMDI